MSYRCVSNLSVACLTCIGVVVAARVEEWLYWRR